jgi:hypothetical protein
MFKLFLFFCLTIVCQSCDWAFFNTSESYGVIVNNTTNEIVYVIESYNYPDTTIPRGQMTHINPKSHWYIQLDNNEIELRKNMESDTISIFFFEKKIIDSNSIDDIIKKNLYTIRKDFHYLKPEELYYP